MTSRGPACYVCLLTFATEAEVNEHVPQCAKRHGIQRQRLVDSFHKTTPRSTPNESCDSTTVKVVALPPDDADQDDATAGPVAGAHPLPSPIADRSPVPPRTSEPCAPEASAQAEMNVSLTNAFSRETSSAGGSTPTLEDSRKRWKEEKQRGGQPSSADWVLKNLETLGELQQSNKAKLEASTRFRRQLSLESQQTDDVSSPHREYHRSTSALRRGTAESSATLPGPETPLYSPPLRAREGPAEETLPARREAAVSFAITPRSLQRLAQANSSAEVGRDVASPSVPPRRRSTSVTSDTTFAQRRRSSSGPHDTVASSAQDMSPKERRVVGSGTRLASLSAPRSQPDPIVARSTRTAIASQPAPTQIDRRSATAVKSRYLDQFQRSVSDTKTLPQRSTSAKAKVAPSNGIQRSDSKPLAPTFSRSQSLVETSHAPLHSVGSSLAAGKTAMAPTTSSAARSISVRSAAVATAASSPIAVKPRQSASPTRLVNSRRHLDPAAATVVSTAADRHMIVASPPATLASLRKSTSADRAPPVLLSPLHRATGGAAQRTKAVAAKQDLPDACAKCGKSFVEEARFCAFCGSARRTVAQ